LDSKVNFKIRSRQKNKKDLMLERKKTVTNCLNLECKNEQLKVLIDRLNNLANKRESFLLDSGDSKQNSEVENQLFNTSSISDELKIAVENSEKLEKNISRLKNKISTIDKELG